MIALHRIKVPLPGGEGLGVGERGDSRASSLAGEHPHPTLPLKGEGLRYLVDAAVSQ